MNKAEVTEKLFEWLVWRQTMNFLRQDAGLLETTANLKLGGGGYGLILRYFSEVASDKEKASLAEIRKAGITLLGAKEDHGEMFVWWQQRGRPDMYRVSEKVLQSASQKLLDGMLINN